MKLRNMTTRHTTRSLLRYERDTTQSLRGRLAEARYEAKRQELRADRLEASLLVAADGIADLQNQRDHLDQRNLNQVQTIRTLSRALDQAEADRRNSLHKLHTLHRVLGEFIEAVENEVEE